MIFKIRIGRWRFTATFAPVVDVKGVNSLLPDNRHILLWDFDNTTLGDITQELTSVQNTYKLPNIYVIETRKPNAKDVNMLSDNEIIALAKLNQLGNYNAYCFKAHDWRKTVEIIAYTRGVDWNYFKWGVFRKRFTLRVTPKESRRSKLIAVLPSPMKEDVKLEQLKSFVQYETLSDQYKLRLIRLG
uniref:Uncharacterized protein n=1 Tax=viral metagenome TaxID=1070528 RepID=A0A6H1ZY86_9ZZZZ